LTVLNKPNNANDKAIDWKKRKIIKFKWLFSPIHIPVKEQWWSYFNTHLPHFLQWWLLNGKFDILQISQDSLNNNSDFGIIKGEADFDIFLFSLVLIIVESIGKFSLEFFSIKPGLLFVFSKR
jgi:hypothetical protein